MDPRRNEELLSVEGIIAAVRRIGPAASQAFYRSIAGEKNTDARLEAAWGLAACCDDEVEENSKILLGLLADEDERVRMAAATSLLILGSLVSREPILQWLDSPQAWRKRAILEQLARVKHANKLAFARSRITAIAIAERLDRGVRDAAQNIVENAFQ
jgi:HEAT repeat protein